MTKQKKFLKFLMIFVCIVLFFTGKEMVQKALSLSNSTPVRNEEEEKTILKKVYNYIDNRSEKFYYGETAHILFGEKEKIGTTVCIGEMCIPAVLTLDNKYYAFFLPFEITDFIVAEEIDGTEIIFSLNSVPQMVNEPMIFIDATSFYILSDMSYVCSVDLQKRADGNCHFQSYYID